MNIKIYSVKQLPILILFTLGVYSSTAYSQGRQANDTQSETQQDQTNKEREKMVSDMLNPWVGQPKQRLLMQLGPPTSTYPDGNGGEILTYIEKRKVWLAYSERYLVGTEITSFYVNGEQKIYHWKFNKSTE